MRRRIASLHRNDGSQNAISRPAKTNAAHPAGNQGPPDEYVIGQDEAGQREDPRRGGAITTSGNLHADASGGDDVESKRANILLTGPSGSAQDAPRQTLACSCAGAVAIADATTLTEAGYVGWG